MSDFNAIQALSMGHDAVYLSKRPLPDAPTGYYDWQINADQPGDSEGHSTFSNVICRAEVLKAKGTFKPNPGEVSAFLDTVKHPKSVDDRKGIFSDGLGILARLHPSSELANKLNNTVINMLYNTNPHPPASYLGPENAFRQADGGGNNVNSYNIGKSGTPYARSVPGKVGLPRTSLPDAGLVFDTLLRRKGIRNHTGGVSSVMFAFASIVKNTLFKTDPRNVHINNASSYLDLSPLYGDNQEELNKVRDKAAGRGFLFPDTFAEERLLLGPASALLVIFSRNHNYIAERILKINERKRWSDPPPEDPAQRALQDEQIFQTARLVNCGHFMNCVLGDYLAGFLGASEGCNWNMNPSDVINDKDLKVDRGLGNHVSAEYGMLYWWHATYSEADERRAEEFFKLAFSNKSATKDNASVKKVFQNVPQSPAERTFYGYKRGPDGKFSDDDLADILQTATETPSQAFRGLGTPGVIRLVEMMAVEQARDFGLCTMNEFRKFLGLKEFKTFEEWNPDPEIAGPARLLYGHIDNLEFYPGVQAEATMPLTNGMRLACGYTMTRAVLGDIVALIRGDRFYTTDLTPHNLTTWGFYDCQRDMSNGALGGQIPKLLLRHLPRHFPWTSVYTLFPFFTPSKMKESLTRQGLASKYTFDKPTYLPVPKVLNTLTGIETVFGNPFRGSSVFSDDSPQDRAMVLSSLFPDKNSVNELAIWYGGLIKAKIEQKSWQYNGQSGKFVDIVNDVINPSSCHFAADKLIGFPLKTKENPSGLYTEMEFYDMLKTLYTSTYLVFDDPEIGFSSRDASHSAGSILGAACIKSILEVSPSVAPNVFSRLAANVASFVWPANGKPWQPFLTRMTQAGKPMEEYVRNIIGLAVGGSVNHAQAASQVIDFYLDDARKLERDHIVELVKLRDAESSALLLGYVSEAMRLRPQISGIWRDSLVDAIVSQGPDIPPLEVKVGDRIFGSLRNAHLNPLDYLDPTSVNPRRSPASWATLNGAGFHNGPGLDYAQKSIVEVVRVVFSLKNVRRAPGDAGKLVGFSEYIHETETNFYIQRNGKASHWPGSMHLMYDL